MSENNNAYTSEPADNFPLIECATVGCPHEVSRGRWSLGYRHCLACGEAAARRKAHCIVPMHKSNYILVTEESSKELLAGINSKTVR